MCDKKRFMLSIDDATYERVRNIKRSQEFLDRPRSELIRYLIGVGLDSVEKKEN